MNEQSWGGSIVAGRGGVAVTGTRTAARRSRGTRQMVKAEAENVIAGKRGPPHTSTRSLRFFFTIPIIPRNLQQPRDRGEKPSERHKHNSALGEGCLTGARKLLYANFPGITREDRREIPETPARCRFFELRTGRYGTYRLSTHRPRHRRRR